MALTEKRCGFRKIEKCIPSKLLTNTITPLVVTVKHIKPNKYLVFRKLGNFFTLILSQGHCTIQKTNKHLRHDLSHAYVLSKLVSD